MMAWCHPTHAQRTRCLCGAVINLSGAVGNAYVKCACGRTHSKLPGSAFTPSFMVQHTASGEYLSTGRRKGGRRGCPGDPIV